jgi:hypothetical protein
MKMFARKTKRNYRIGILTAVILCLCGLIAALMWPVSPVETPETGINPDYNPSVETGGYDSDDDPLLNEEEEEILPEKVDNSMNQNETSYYLVKKAGDAIAVFFCDISGNMVQLETTDILYGMLGPEDQKLFDIGIRVDTQEELGVLLQDFEG